MYNIKYCPLFVGVTSVSAGFLRKKPASNYDGFFGNLSLRVKNMLWVKTVHILFVMSWITVVSIIVGPMRFHLY